MRGGGCQRLWKSRREGGLNLKKSSTGVISTDSSRDSNFYFGNTLALSDPENSRNILFTYFSPDINDNLSSFAGPFIAENANNNLLKNEPSQRCCNEEVETRDTFLLVPRPARHRCVISLSPVEISVVWCKDNDKEKKNN